MMAEIDMVMTDFYNVLCKLRYPKITEVESTSIASIIFKGENRIHLLSWLLTEKIPHIATVLEKLEGSALQDQLAEYYSQLGICTNKDILLGKCTLEEQLPALTLLLQFISNVYVDTTDIPSNGTESIANLLTEYFTENTNNLHDIKKTNSQETNKSEKLKKINIPSKENKTSITELSVDNVRDDDVKCNNNERKENFISQIDKFIDTYESVSSWPVSNVGIKNTSESSMNTYVKNIYSDFTVLKQMLQTKREIPKFVIPQEPAKRYIPLNSVVQDMVSSIDEDLTKI